MSEKYKSGYSEKHFKSIKSFKINVKDGYKYDGIELTDDTGKSTNMGTDYIGLKDAVLFLNDLTAYKEEQHQLEIESLKNEIELLTDQLYVNIGR